MSIDKQEEFLRQFVEHRGDVDAARKAAGVAKGTFYTWMREDATFRERLDAYRLAMAEEVESEAFRRVLNPTSQRGSDALVTTLLRGLRKSRYGETAQGGQSVNIVYVSGLRAVPRPGQEALPAPDDEHS